MAELDDDLFLVSVADPEDRAHRQTLSFSRSPTVLLTFAACRFTRSAARLYQKRYGIGAMDWRMLVMLTREPDCSVSRASQTIGIDKAAVSRSLDRLQKMGLAAATAPESNSRRRTWRLTGQGHALHLEILNMALGRQKRLLSGFSEADVKKFNHYLQLFMTNLEKLDQETGL